MNEKTKITYRVWSCLFKTTASVNATFLPRNKIQYSIPWYKTDTLGLGFTERKLGEKKIL